jgi:hypothetical protein
MIPTPDPSADQPPVFCAHCAAILQPGSGNFYVVDIQAIADPTPPIISAEELAGDVREQIRHLLAQLEHLSEQEALDQVYRRLTLYLCVPCYRRWIEDPTGCEAANTRRR